MSTVSDHVNQQQSSNALAVMDRHKPELLQVLPSHMRAGGLAEGWYASAQAALRKNVDLYRAAAANPGSLMNALNDAARLGLAPGTDEYYLTIKKGQVLGIVGYQGEVELIYRAGAASSVVVEAVHENDDFLWVPGQMTKPTHRTPQGNWFKAGDRGQVVGAYAYAVMVDGAVSKVVIVDDERIKRAIAASPTGNSTHSPWKTDYRSMVLKTAAHDLAKWVPTSPEFAREKLRVQRDVALEHPTPARAAVDVSHLPEAPPQQRAPLEPPPVVDAELVDEPPTDQEKRSRLMYALLGEAGLSATKDRDRRIKFLTLLTGRDIGSSADLDLREREEVIAFLQQLKEGRWAPRGISDAYAIAQQEATGGES